MVKFSLFPVLCRLELDRSYYLVELNPDSQSASDRPEWCCVRYSSTFHHMRGFELEFQWMATTVSLLKKMVRLSCTAHIYHAQTDHTQLPSTKLSRLSTSARHLFSAVTKL